VTPDRILAIARGEIGIKATAQNNVKYNTAYYGQVINKAGYAWCAVFVWWCFQQAGASDLYYGSGKTAYCPTLLSYHSGQAVTDYQPGDIIFFNFSGKSNAAHVGICERYDGTDITTIDGNTSLENEANGGTVARRMRNKRCIVGAYRPAYQKEEDDMDQTAFNALMDGYFAERAKRNQSSWAKDSKLAQKGIYDGSRPQALPTREELAQMLVNLKK